MSFPLLGKSPEILGDFKANCIPKIHLDSSGERKYLFQLTASDVEINNPVIEKLIHDEKAALTTTVSCGATLFNKTFTGLDQIIVDPNEIAGRTLIITTISATSDFVIDLSTETTVSNFFKHKTKVGKGKHLSTQEIRSFNFPVLDSGSSGSIFSFKYEDVDEISVDFGENDEGAAKVKITYPDKNFVESLNLYLKIHKQYSALSTSLFFESILVEMFRHIKTVFEEHVDIQGKPEHEFYDCAKPWMQELINQYGLLDSGSKYSFRFFDDFNTVYNIINRTSNSEMVIANSLKQLNIISENNG